MLSFLVQILYTKVQKLPTLSALNDDSCRGRRRAETLQSHLLDFRFELIYWIHERQCTKLVVLSNKSTSTEQGYTEDLLAIVHVFSCRFKRSPPIRLSQPRSGRGWGCSRRRARRRSTRETQMRLSSEQKKSMRDWMGAAQFMYIKCVEAIKKKAFPWTRIYLRVHYT